MNVGLVVTVSPLRPLELRVHKDGTAADAFAVEQALELEAKTSLDLEIADVARLQVRGGRREAQDTLRALEQRWATEFAPRLAAAGAADLSELDARLAEARTLESDTTAKKTELATLEEQLAASAGAEDAQRAAADRLRTCRAALGKASPEPLLEEIAALGADPAGALRKRKERSAKALDAARAKAADAQTAHGVAEERLRSSTIEARCRHRSQGRRARRIPRRPSRGPRSGADGADLGKRGTIAGHAGDRNDRPAAGRGTPQGGCGAGCRPRRCRQGAQGGGVCAQDADRRDFRAFRSSGSPGGTSPRASGGGPRRGGGVP